MSRNSHTRRHLDKIIGKKIVGYRYGDGGFDLILDDGTELEVYTCIPLALEKSSQCDCKKMCGWGLVAVERRLFPVESLEKARKIVEEVLRKTSIRDIDTASTLNGYYVTVAEHELKKLGKECEKLSDEAVSALCG